MTLTSKDIYMLVMARSQRIVHGLTDYNAPVLDPEDCLDVATPAPVARRVQQCVPCNEVPWPKATCTRGMTLWKCGACGRFVSSEQTYSSLSFRFCSAGCDWRLCE
jgi:hypothetical protein